MKNQTLLKNIKQEFRLWYGLLSFDEIMLNHKLIKIIEHLESHQEFQGTSL
ncbi:MAG: hypothetical protein KDD34_07380 [Bdellovibrionales bacterium]|nr:hypothetical protein [Bdellovibrionales bacterium]